MSRLLDMRQEKHNILYCFLVDKKFRVWRHILLILMITIIAINGVFWSFGESYPILGNKIYWIVLFSLILYLTVIYFNLYILVPKLQVFEDGTEEILNDNLSYKEVNSDDFLQLPIATDEELKASINEVYKWFTSLEQNMEEGIVIKPHQAFIPSMPPAFKVRNNQYLTMIYGVNFHENYDYYIQKRSIRHKLDCSINDWTLNHELLKVKYNEIDKENYYLKNLVFDRIMGEKSEATLDNRL